MLARYPKVEPVPSNRSCSHLLPRLCLQQDQDSRQDPAEPGHNKQGLVENHCLTRRGCDSAPVLFGHDSSSFRFVFEDKNSKYPKQIRVEQNPHFLWFTSASGGSTVISEADDAQMVDDVSSEDDFIKISRCLQLLYNSGYYYEGLSWQQASMKLRKCRVGTFLVRESENPNFLFTLSVQTKMGPTSIRIAYKGGLFRLDAEEELVHQMPVFASVTDLVEYYVRVSKQLPVKSDPTCCWLDLAGECTAPVELYQPLYKQVPSLKHLCRMNVVRQILKKGRLREDCWTSLGLPVALHDYLEDYPHSQ